MENRGLVIGFLFLFFFTGENAFPCDDCSENPCRCRAERKAIESAICENKKILKDIEKERCYKRKELEEARAENKELRRKICELEENLRCRPVIKEKEIVIENIEVPVEKRVEIPVPGPVQIIEREKIVEVEGPVRVVEKIVHVPGPVRCVEVPVERIVEKIIRVPCYVDRIIYTNPPTCPPPRKFVPCIRR